MEFSTGLIIAGDRGKSRKTLWSGRDTQATRSAVDSRVLWLNRSKILPGQNRSRCSRGDVGANHADEVASGFEGLFAVVVRDEAGVVIEGHVPLSPETVEDSQQAGVF